MLLLVLCCWIREIVDLHVTALLVVVLTVLLGLVEPEASTDAEMIRVDTLNMVLSIMWSETVVLLLGGFTIAAALTKTNLTKMFASLVISACGDSVPMVLLGCMMLAAIFSMFISNVAAPLLMYTVLDPVLRTYGANEPSA